MFAVNILSQFMVEPRIVHWVVTKHVLRYLARTVEYGLNYRKSDGIKLIYFTDLDWEGSVADRKRTSGCCLSFGSIAVSWFNWSVALSSAEAEYMVSSQASCEVMWLHKLMVNLFGQELRPAVILL